MNICSACGEDFAGVRDFDAHRIGAFPQKGPADYKDRWELGMVDREKDWLPKMGRRCLSSDEMDGSGWGRNSLGRWQKYPSAVSYSSQDATDV